ncbi:hypothetical protein BD309DRAFT_956377 [Dichomitus squalens]|nr:hypothetical protein BD309DRAFT_956377 [Dichomitus squalens]
MPISKASSDESATQFPPLSVACPKRLTNEGHCQPSPVAVAMFTVYSTRASEYVTPPVRSEASPVC